MTDYRESTIATTPNGVTIHTPSPSFAVLPPRRGFTPMPVDYAHVLMSSLPFMSFRSKFNIEGTTDV